MVVGAAICRPRANTGAICDRPLCRGIEHVFDEDTVAGGGIVDEDMGDGADQLAVLDNGTAAHADVK